MMDDVDECEWREAVRVRDQQERYCQRPTKKASSIELRGFWWLEGS
jgi:hypothetical protein